MSRAQKIMDLLQIQNKPTIQTTAIIEENNGVSDNVEIVPMPYYETIHIIPLSSPYEVISNDDNIMFVNHSRRKGFSDESVRPQREDILADNSNIEIIDESSNYESLMLKPLVPYSDTDDSIKEISIDTQRKRRKKNECKPDKSKWKSHKNKINRERGNQYIGRKKSENVWKEFPKDKRQLKKRCQCQPTKKGILNCFAIMDNERDKLFNDFWIMNWDQKKVFVNSLVKMTSPKRQKLVMDTAVVSKRSASFFITFHVKKRMLKCVR